MTDAGNLGSFPGSSKFELKIRGSTGNNGTKAVKKMVPLKYLSNFWGTLEMTINYENNLILILSENCVISNAAANQATTFAVTDTKFYVPVVTLSPDDNGKRL